MGGFSWWEGGAAGARGGAAGHVTSAVRERSEMNAAAHPHLTFSLRKVQDSSLWMVLPAFRAGLSSSVKLL